MAATALEIGPLAGAALAAAIGPLADILRDAVAGGASVSFLDVPSPEEARAFWEGVARSVDAGDCVLLGAFAQERLVGTVQLHPSRMPNQPHRADVAKLLVASSARRSGVGSALMAAVEATARARGLTLLTLDTWADGAADRLYRARGWRCAGTIPGYALGPDRGPVDTAIFYKTLD